MKPSILYVSYPLLTVSQESAGGAEQVLRLIEREFAARGYRTTVAASRGSRVSGRSLITGDPADGTDQFEQREREHSRVILGCLWDNPQEFDLIHDQSGSFWRHACECPVPVLATLHLPRSFYREEWFASPSLKLSFNCVSESQARTFADLPNLIGVVQNGIDVREFPLKSKKRDYVLWLGRICEEKAPHLAIEAARRAGVELIIAGQVYPFSYHQSYVERVIRPAIARSNSRVPYIESPAFATKLELLSNARALLLTSTVEETSSLVAIEAMACGTPVVGFCRGAFPEIVTDGETGFLVGSVGEIADALKRVDEISSEKCRAHVEKYFTSARMANDYAALYQRILTRASSQNAA